MTSVEDRLAKLERRVTNISDAINELANADFISIRITMRLDASDLVGAKELMDELEKSHIKMRTLLNKEK